MEKRKVQFEERKFVKVIKVLKTNEEKEEFLYPLKKNCDICGAIMNRVSGDNFYKFAHRCTRDKCKRNKEYHYGENVNNDFRYDKDENIEVYNVPAGKGTFLQ